MPVPSLSGAALMRRFLFLLALPKILTAIFYRARDICVPGYALAKFRDQRALPVLLRHTWVYVRVSLEQKEEILLGLKDQGYTTLICCDGTNDVGALKQAHMGVALLNDTSEDLTKIAEHFRITKVREIYKRQVVVMKRSNQPSPPVLLQIAHLYPPGPTNPCYEKAMQREAGKLFQLDPHLRNEANPVKPDNC